MPKKNRTKLHELEKKSSLKSNETAQFQVRVTKLHEQKERDKESDKKPIDNERFESPESALSTDHLDDTIDEKNDSPNKTLQSDGPVYNKTIYPHKDIQNNEESKQPKPQENPSQAPKTQLFQKSDNMKLKLQRFMSDGNQSEGRISFFLGQDVFEQKVPDDNKVMKRRPADSDDEDYPVQLMLNNLAMSDDSNYDHEKRSQNMPDLMRADTPKSNQAQIQWALDSILDCSRKSGQFQLEQTQDLVNSSQQLYQLAQR